MRAVNILDARNNLSRLVAAAQDGEEVVIARRGAPVVRIVPVTEAMPDYTAGSAAVWMTKNLPPGTTRPAPGELDERIAESRESWE